MLELLITWLAVQHMVCMIDDKWTEREGERERGRQCETDSHKDRQSGMRVR